VQAAGKKEEEKLNEPTEQEIAEIFLQLGRLSLEISLTG